MKKLAIFLILVLILCPSIIAQNAEELLCSYGTYRPGENIRIIQTCATCTYNNISSISSPDGTVLISNIAMSQSGSEYSYDLNGSFTQTLGSWATGNPYVVNGEGNINGEAQTWKCYFGITKTGRELNQSESYMYIILTIAIFLFFLLSLYGALAIPYSNKKNDNGAAIQVTRHKYIKMLLIMTTYGLFVWFLNVLIYIGDNFVGSTIYFNFIALIFNFLNRISLYFSIFIIVLAIFEVIRDANLSKRIKEISRLGRRYGG